MKNNFKYIKCFLFLCLINVLVAINVTIVNAFEDKNQLLQPGQMFYYFSDKPSIDEINNELPKQLNAKIDGCTVNVDVSWECFTNDYFTTDFYAYQFVPKVSDLSMAEKFNEKEAPYVFVCMGDMVVDNSYNGELSTLSSFSDNKNMKKVIKYLTNTMGLSSTAACGIAANIYCESNCQSDIMEYGYTWDEGAGYGLCQWTNYPRTSTTGRRTELIKFAARLGLDYKTIDTQLKYLYWELTTSYITILNKLKEIKPTSDLQQDTYDAAYLWCYEYEIPADKENASIARGNFAKTIWNCYGDAQVVTRAAKLENPSFPSQIAQGKGFSVKGVASATKEISKIKIAVTDTLGKSMISKSVLDVGKSYKLSLLDNYIRFDKLKSGQYFYKIYVTTEDGTYLLINKDFIVCNETPSIWSYSKPATYDCGNAFMICGDIVSSANISSIKAGIYKSSSGKSPKYQVEMNVNSKSFDMNTLNSSLLFHKLSGGNYYYRIDVNSGGTITNVLNCKFIVEPSNIPRISEIRQNYKAKLYLSIKWNKIAVADGYRVYRADEKDGRFVKIATVKGCETILYKDTGLKRNKSYYYKVYPYIIKNKITTLGPASAICEAKTK